MPTLADRQQVEVTDAGIWFYLGRIESQLKFSYFFKRAEDAETIIQAIQSFFGHVLEQRYGQKSWETSRFLLTSLREATGNPEVRRDERKLEFLVDAEWPQLEFDKDAKVIKKIKLSVSVSEDPKHLGEW